MDSRKQKEQEGVALVVVLLTLFLIAVFGFALGARGTQILAASLIAEKNNVSLYAAEAGIARVFYAMEQSDSSLPSPCLCTSSPSCPGTACTGAPGFTGGNNLSDGSQFTLSITANNSSSVYPVTASDGTLVPPGMYYIKSTGAYGGFKRILSALASVSTSWPFANFAIFGGNGLTLSGNAAITNNVGTNSITSGAVSLSGNANIQGSVTIGPGGNAGTVIQTSGNAQYNGSTVLQNPISMAVIADPLGGYGTQDVQSGSISPGQYDNLDPSGNNTITLQCGIYSIKSLNMSGNSQLIIPPACGTDNPVKLYVYNNLSLSGNGIVNSNSTAFLVYGMSSLTSVALSGNGSANLALYAPSASVSITGNGNFDGAIAGQSITVSGNGNIQYDRNLTNDNNWGGPPRVNVLSVEF